LFIKKARNKEAPCKATNEDTFDTVSNSVSVKRDKKGANPCELARKSVIGVTKLKKQTCGFEQYL